jgi:hypothetical protein
MMPPSKGWAWAIAHAVVESWLRDWRAREEAPMRHVDDLEDRIAAAIREVATIP